ncbi:MAG TPA: hypothetical protein VFH51_11075 [Myxococcota bacterium]|nr:hypothetical protein [Myxococcota bacterium]
MAESDPQRSPGYAERGELACASSRILLILDIARAYRRLKDRDNKVWKELGEGLPAFTGPAFTG